MNFLTLVNGLKSLAKNVDFIDFANGAFRSRLTGTATVDGTINLPNGSGTLQIDNLSKVRYLFVMAGESNSGGVAANSTLTAIDLVAQSQLKIWNNTSSVFQPLQIGTNNLISHAVLTDNTTHSIERGLAREILNTLQWPEAYLLKAGQGGSTIATWSVGNASGYLTTLTTRYNAAISAITSQGFIVRPILIWFNGINDAVAGTNATTFRTATQAHFVQIRSLMGSTTPIFMPQIMPTNAAYTAINTEIATIDAADPNMWALATVGIPQDPNNIYHYTANGYLRIARAFVDSFRNNLGIASTLSIGQARTESSNPIVALKRNTVQTIPHAVATAVVLNLVEADTDNMFASTNGNVVIATGAEGLYTIAGSVALNGSQQCRAQILINGVVRAQGAIITAATDIVLGNDVPPRMFRLNAGDVVALHVYQSNSTSATKDLYFTQPELQSCLQMQRIGR